MKSHLLRLLLLACLAPLAASAASPATYTLQAPGSGPSVELRVTDRIHYDIKVRETTVVQNATLSLTIDGVTLGLAPRVLAATPRTHDGTLAPIVRQKAATLREHYNELRLDCAGGYALVFRAYAEGVAYRWETSLPVARVKVQAEEVALRFGDNYTVYYPEEEGFHSHNERLFLPRALGDLAPQNLASIPAVVATEGFKLALCDADVVEYPGLWFRGTGGSALTGVFPPYPLKETLTGDRELKVTAAGDYLALTAGTRTYPWRVFGFARRDTDLITNSLVYLLARPSEIADPSWIKPGKVAWDWWNANNLKGVDFKAGVNTATYKYYIDFASRHGLEYIILDEGWYKLGNVLDVVPEMNIEELVAYGKQKNVGIILWVVWNTLDAQLQPALDQFARWGVRGIKVDFMQRDDQLVIDYYHKLCREAAQRHLLVDFHGGIRAALMTRTWPNLISTEGVRGLEHNKWSAHVTPAHDATLPFTRMFAGPMDYTPGAMTNATRKGFAAIFERPMSQGTRSHQLALYVIYESPLQMLADAPTSYEREPAAMKFLSAVPSVWDETRPLDGRIAEYVAVARRSGSDWYVGAITDWNPRELALDLSFLPAGDYELTACADGPNADRHAEDTQVSARPVTRATKLTVQLASGGGWAGILRPKKN